MPGSKPARRPTTRPRLLLLQQHSSNRGLVSLLLKKESPAHRQKLIYELVKVGCEGRMQDVNEVLNHFAQAVQGAVQHVANVLVEARPPESGPAFPEQPAPEHVSAQLQAQADDITQLMQRLYNERCQLSNSLATLDPADGPRVVGQILALEQQYNALAQQRRNLVEGEPTAPAQPATAEPTAPEAAALSKEESAAPGIDRAELMKKRNTLRSNISKAKKNAETAKTEEKRSEYAQKAGKLAVELDQVEMQLKA